MEGYDAREYQEKGTLFLKTIRRGFLTDDPGLGKTMQAIRATELPALVVAPKYLCGQWEEAIKREHEDAVIGFADGTRVQRDTILSKRADWYIINMEMLATYALPDDIATYINDESHRFRNRTANFSKAAVVIENVNPNSRVYNLTATPFWKSASDIWMQARILYPKIFTSYHDFVKLYFNSVSTPQGGSKATTVKKYMRADLKRLFKPIMLGRTYAQVGRYLPEIIESTIKIDMPVELRAIYKKLKDDYTLTFGDEEEKQKLIFQPTTVLHTLRQITAASGKYDAIMETIKDNNDKPSIIGFWYKDHAREMQKRLGDHCSVLITGDMAGTERLRLAMWAQANKKHIVASEGCFSEGLNLYHYRIFIFGEEHYIPGMNHQFLSRVVRDRNDNGKDRDPVRVFYVQVRNSIDVDIHRVSINRREAINATRQLLELTLKKD